MIEQAGDVGDISGDRRRREVAFRAKMSSVLLESTLQIRGQPLDRRLGRSSSG